MKFKKAIAIVAGTIVLLFTWSAQITLRPSLTVKLVTETIAAVKPFYEGKTITMVIPSDPGGGYDLYARLIARNMGRHIPGNPKFVVENMAGAGGLIAANHVYNRVKPDGLTFMDFQTAVLLRQLAGDPDVLVDVRKMHWIGSACVDTTICVIRNDVRYQKIDDMIGAKEPIILAASPATTREYYPKMINEVLGTNFKVITGYKSGGANYVALENREVDGACGIAWDSLKAERPYWLKDNFAHVFLQLNPGEKLADIPNVPWIMDYVKPADRQLVEAAMGTQLMGKSFVAPPGVPNNRIEILRKAFIETLKDQALLAEAARTQSNIKARTGNEVEAFIKKWFSISKESADKIRRIYFPAGFK